MAEPASSPSDPPPAPGIPEIRIRKGSEDPSEGENHFEKSGSESPPLPAVDEDAVSKDEVFAGDDPYTQGYGQLADEDNPFGIKLEHPHAHEPAGVADDMDDRVSRVTNPDAPSPTSEVSMEVDDDSAAASSLGYTQMDIDSTSQQNGNAVDAASSIPKGIDMNTADAWAYLDSQPQPTLPSPMLELDYDMFDTKTDKSETPEAEEAPESPPETKKMPPPRPPPSPSGAPPRPVSPAADRGRRSVSPARPEPPRSRSPARPVSPNVARSKSPMRPPPPRSPQTVGGESGKKVPPARPPSRPPPPGIKKVSAPSPDEFEQEESELVEINANKDGSAASPSEDAVGASAANDEDKITIKLPGHRSKHRGKSPKRSPSAEPVEATAAAAPKWATFDDAQPLGMDTEQSPESPEESTSPEEDDEEQEPEPVAAPEKKKPPPRPAPPSGAPSRPPPPNRPAAPPHRKPDEPAKSVASRPKAAKEKKSKGLKKTLGIGKKKKHKGDDDFDKIFQEGGERLPSGAGGPKSAQFAEFEAMQARIAGSVSASAGRLGDVGKEIDKTIAHIEATNSPWTVMIGGAPGENKGPLSSPLDDNVHEVSPAVAKPGWQGFGDDGFGTLSGESAQKLATTTLSTTPQPSPKHPPVPPNNSRRNSGDADLLGLMSGGGGDTETTEQKESMNSDLLGLMGGENGQEQESGGMMADTLNLSRNPPAGSGRSSGRSTPELGEAKVDGDITSNDPYIDSFLGIDGKDGAAMGTAEDDDPFGLGAKKEEEPVDPMELVTGALHDEDDDPFALPPEVDAIAAGENITEAPEVEKETTGDDFLSMAVKVAQEAKEESKDRDPEDFGGFGTPIVSNTEKERKVEVITTEAKKSGKSVVIKSVARPRPKKAMELATFLPPPPQKEEIKEQNDLLMISPGSDDFDPRADIEAEVRPMPDNADSIWSEDQRKGENPFKADVDAKLEAHKAQTNPFLNTDESSSKAEGTEDVSKEGEEEKEAKPHDEFDIFGPVDTTKAAFNPFATIVPDDDAQPDSFDPFATIQGEDAFVDIKKGSAGEAIKEGEEGEEGNVTSPRVNPFDKEPPLDDKFASFEPKVEDKPSEPLFEAFTEKVEEEEQLEPLPPYREPFTGDGWHLLLRQPAKKKLTSNRYWKSVYVRLVIHRDTPTVRVYNNDKDAEIFHELPLQPCYQMCDMGLQQYDQYGKCHTVKIQYVFYRERVGMKADRITPTLGDIARVRDLKGLKNLVHKPKATMILDHAPQASELLKFGSLDYDEFRSFVWTLEESFFHLISNREIKSQNYTKDEITIDIVDEYYLDIDNLAHITFHKARVRVFCLAFLTGNPTVELGINNRWRKGKEIVGRKDIIPIRTDEWIRIEDPEFHNSIDQTEYEKSKVIKFIPLDACHFELMRFRTRPKKNKELPLQIRVQQAVRGNHIEIRADVIIVGYYSNSRRAQQTPCEDISIVFQIPEPWVYMFRVEKRFKYGSVKATTRKPGKIKGLERLTQMAQGLMPPALIEVSTGGAKYENVYHGIVWRIARLPERNEGAYKQHFFKLRVDLGPHDVMPDTFEKYVAVQFQMPNSMVSRAQVRSIGVSDVEDPPDRWVHHLAKYEYTVEIENVDETRTSAPEVVSTVEEPTTPNSDEDDSDEDDDDDDDAPVKPPPPRPEAEAVAESDSSSSSDDD